MKQRTFPVFSDTCTMAKMRSEAKSLQLTLQYIISIHPKGFLVHLDCLFPLLRDK